MQRLIATARAVALSGALLAPSGTAASAAGDTATTATAQRATVETRFAMHARGLGTKIRSGDLPAGSDPVGSKAFNCTNLAGKSGENFVAQANLPQLGTVNGVRTKVWTQKRGDTVASNAKQTIAGITLDQGGFGTVEFGAITSRSRTWHDSSGYHAKASARIAGITYTPPEGEPQEIEVPAPGETVEIPGVMSISAGVAKRRVNRSSAYTAINALDIQIPSSSTRIKAGYSRARIAEGVVSGLFQGFSSGVTGSVVNPLVKIGKVPNHQMPCEGTDGEVTEKTVADLTVPNGVLEADGITASQRGTQRRGLAAGFEQAEIANVSLSGGDILVEAVKARANVRREDGDLTRNARGTGIGRLVIQGEEHPLPFEETIEIPGLARIEPRVVERIRNGIKVVALRVTLLDGSGAEIDLGIAQLRINRA